MFVEHRPFFIYPYIKIRLLTNKQTLNMLHFLYLCAELTITNFYEQFFL